MNAVRILLAFDKFKGTLTGLQVAAVVSGILTVRLPTAEVRSVPLADGGDGTLAIALAHGFRPRVVASADALGRPASTTVGMDGRRGFIEMAEVCGLADIAPAERDGRRSTSLGLGLAARALLDLGVDDITIGLGGSASTDGGLGFLVGLGVRPVDADGSACAPDLVGLDRTRALLMDTVHPKAPSCHWTFLTDVDSPLLGDHGAARVFGPQKGLTPLDVQGADAALSRWADLVLLISGRDLAGAPGAGAAGGIVVGAAVLAEPRIESGAEYVARLTGLDAQLAWAELVITGEGRLDDQSLLGKGPGLVIERAGRAGVPVGVIAGRIDLDPLPDQVVVAVSLEEVAGSGDAAMANPAHWLAEATSRLVAGYASTGRPSSS